jgi:hypothetical protein
MQDAAQCRFWISLFGKALLRQCSTVAVPLQVRRAIERVGLAYSAIADAGDGLRAISCEVHVNDLHKLVFPSREELVTCGLVSLEPLKRDDIHLPSTGNIPSKVEDDFW